MSGLLNEMTQVSLARLEQARAREPEKKLWSRATDAPPAPPLKLSPEGFDILAECKLASPSAGDLSANTTDVNSRVQAYGRGGACAVSVLTEPTRFGGNLEHLALGFVHQKRVAPPCRPHVDHPRRVHTFDTLPNRHVAGLVRRMRLRCREVQVELERVETAVVHEIVRKKYACPRCREGQRLVIPVKHGEGCYVVDPDTLARLEARDQVVLRYEAGANPNGSIADIAGVVSAEGNVMGLMPHPEHAVDELLGSTDGVYLLGSLADAAADRARTIAGTAA